MTEIIIRSHKGEYTGGETVYGAVYLKVDAPTAGHGIRLKFHGYETYHHKVGDEQGKTFSKRSLHGEPSSPEPEEQASGTKEYIQSHDMKLYDFETPIALGCYVFPFQKILPNDLPRSFTYSTCGCDGVPTGYRWECQITYNVEAELMGAESVRGSVSLIVNQGCDKTGMEVVKTVEVRGLLPFQKSTLSVSAKLDKPVYYTDEDIGVSLDFNTKGMSRLKILSVAWKLNRDFSVSLQQRNFFSPNPSQSPSNNNLWNPFKFLPIFCAPENAKSTDSQVRSLNFQSQIRPCGGPHVLWEKKISNKNGLGPSELLPKYTMSLKDVNRGDDLPTNLILPSTVGAHIVCVYYVTLEASLRGTSVINMVLPVSSIQERPTAWDNWDPPDWLFQCELRTREGDCNVSSHTLDSEIFSRLPMFQTV